MTFRHAKFDPAAWMSLFRKYRDGDDKLNPRYLPMVRGPLDACDLLSARQAVTSINTVGRESPTDVFIWRLGDPVAPYLTQVGGIPYMQKSTPWPVTSSGRPAEYLCQINFCDSLDIVGNLIQGDLLLVFCGARREEPEYYFVWETVAPGHDLRGFDEIDGFAGFATCSGEIWRTFNLVDWMGSPESFALQLDDGREVDFPHKLYAIHGTQIGSRPFPFNIDLDQLKPSQLLCCVTSPCPGFSPYPFLNHAAPLGRLGENLLPIDNIEDTFLNFGGDGETLYIFVDELGETWGSTCSS